MPFHISHVGFRPIAAGAAITFAVVSLASAEPLPGWDKPLHGLVVTTPAGWSKEVDADDEEVVDFTCNTPECASSQQTCTVIVPDEPMNDVPAFVPGAWMVALTSGDEEMRKDVLEDTQEGTEITKEPGTIWLDGRSWYTTETLAPYGWKSNLNAVGLANGRYVRVDCWTCDRDENRFAFAKDFLKGVGVSP